MSALYTGSNFYFGYNIQILDLSKLPAEAVHKDGTGCDRNFHGEQKEKENV